MNTGEGFLFDISAYRMFSIIFFIIASQFHVNDVIFQTQDDWNIIYPLFAAMPASPHCLI